MTNQKHTSEKWTYQHYNTGWKIKCGPPESCDIAVVFGGDENEARVRLMTAAPATARQRHQLLAAAIKVKTLLEEGDGFTQEQQWKTVFSELYAAISDAEKEVKP